MSGDSDLRKLLSSAALVIVGGLLGSSARLIERLIVGNVLSPAAYGRVSIGLAILSIASTVSLVGFTQAIPRYMSRFDDPADVRGVWVTGLLVAGALSLVVSAAVFLNAPLIARVLSDSAENALLVRLFALTIPFLVGMRVGVGAVRGFENTVYRTYAKDLLYPIGRISILVALLGLGYGAVAAGYAYVAAAAAAFVLAHALLHRLMPLVGEFTLRPRSMVRFSAPLVVSTILGLLLLQVDTLLLGYFKSSYVVGQYSAAFPLANGILIVLGSFGFMYLPLASRLDADGEREEVDRIYKVTTKWIYVLTFPGFAAFLLFPEDVIRIFFGPEYLPAALPLSVLSIGFFTNALAGRNRETISALGRTEYVLAGNAAAFVLNVALNLLLIPPYGAVGAAVASAISLVSLNVVIYGLLRSKFDISPFSRWSIRTMVSLPVVFLPLLYVLSRHVSLSALTLLPFLVALGLSTLPLVGLVGGVQPEDRILLDFVESRAGVEVPLVRRYFQRQ